MIVNSARREVKVNVLRQMLKKTKENWTCPSRSKISGGVFLSSQCSLIPPATFSALQQERTKNVFSSRN